MLSWDQISLNGLKHFGRSRQLRSSAVTKSSGNSVWRSEDDKNVDYVIIKEFLAR